MNDRIPSTRIRGANREDAPTVRQIYLDAFPDSEQDPVARLAVNLLSEESEPATLSLVAERAGEVVGHIAFSPVTSGVSGGWVGYLLAPLAVAPPDQGVGIGSALVRRGIDLISSRAGDEALLVYGDPDYYGRFGFRAATAERYLAPYPLEYPFGWQGLVPANELAEESIAIDCVPPLADPGLW